MTLEPLHFNAILHGLRATDKTQILQNLSWKIASKKNGETSADMTWIADQLIRREEKENSAIGDGVAIAHLKSSPLSEPFLILARLDEPLDFKADDDQKVDLVCILISGCIDDHLHLQRLSRVTRLFRNLDLLASLRACKSESEMGALLNIEHAHLIAA